MSTHVPVHAPDAWLRGSRPDTRRHVNGLLFSCGTYLVYMAILQLQVHLGRSDAGEALLVSVAAVLVQALLYGLIRSGWTRRLRDPGLGAAQIRIGVGFMYAGYAVLGAAAPALLIVMASHVVYSMFSMSPRAVWRLVAGSLAGLALTMVACHMAWPERYPADLQVVAFLYAALVVPLIALLARKVAEMRERLLSQSAQLKAALAEVRELASRDELTRTHNRHCMTTLLTEQRQRHADESAPLSLALLDIDHFKRINDTRGHAVGDDVLRGFATLVKAELRTTDLVARWGGEEFLVALPHTGRDTALDVLQRVQAALSGPDGRRLMPSGVTVSFSAGLVELQPDEALDAAIARADRAMYAAKHDGRARCVAA